MGKEEREERWVWYREELGVGGWALGVVLYLSKNLSLSMVGMLGFSLGSYRISDAPLLAKAKIGTNTTMRIDRISSRKMT